MSSAATFPALTPRTRSPASLPSLIDRENRRRRRRRIALFVALAAIPVAVLSIWLAVRPKPIPMARRFRVEAVSQGDVIREVHATGHVEAESTVNVGAEVSGRLASVEVDFNDRVAAGQVMARFDRTALAAQVQQIEATLAAARAAVSQAETDLHQARHNADRANQLFAAHALSAADHDVATFALQSAENRLRTSRAQVAAQVAAAALARTNLERTVILAPIDGIVVTRNVDPGQTVISALQSATLFSVAADLRRMRVVAAVDEADIGQVVRDQTVEFTVNAYPDRTFRGTVTEVRNAALIVQDVVTYGTVIDVDNPDLALRPGMTASVRIRTGAARNVLRVPNTALHFVPPGQRAATDPGVWTLDSTLHRVAVRTGLSDGQYTLIEPGTLTAGRRVIVELTHEGRRAYGIGR